MMWGFFVEISAVFYNFTIPLLHDKRIGIAMYKVIIALVLLFAPGTAHGQFDWNLKKDEDGIRIFTATTPGSDIKSIKVEFTVDASLHQFLAFLMDIPRQPDWVYNTRMSKVLRVTQPNELIFYSQVNVPWPGTDRDYISTFTVRQVSKELTVIDSRAAPDLMPVQKGFVRIKKSTAHWEITTLSASSLKLVYTLSFDPAGSVPAWLTNLFLTTGPSHTFKKLREGIKKPEYRNAKVSFLKQY